MITIQYQPYVGLIYEDQPVHTKMKDGKLHFFQYLNGDVHMDEMSRHSVDELKAGEIEDVKYLGYTELINDV